MIGFECLDVQPSQANKLASEIGRIRSAPVNQTADRRDNPAKTLNDINCFLNLCPARYNVFDHNQTFARLDFESPSQDEFAILLIREHVAFAESPTHFLAHYNSDTR